MPPHSISSADPTRLRDSARTLHSAVSSATKALSTAQSQIQTANNWSPDVVPGFVLDTFTRTANRLKSSTELGRLLNSIASSFERADDPYYYDGDVSWRRPDPLSWYSRALVGFERVLMEMTVKSLVERLGESDDRWRTDEARERELDVLPAVKKLPPEYLRQFVREVGVERFADLYETFSVQWLNDEWSGDMTSWTAGVYAERRAQASASGTEAEFIQGTDGERLALQATTADQDFIDRVMSDQESVEFNRRASRILSENHWGSFGVTLAERTSLDKRQGRNVPSYQHYASNSLGAAVLLSGELSLEQQRDVARNVHATQGSGELRPTDRLFAAVAHADVATPIGYQSPQLPGEMLGGVGGVRLLTPKQAARLMDSEGSDGYGRGTFGLVDDAFDSVPMPPTDSGLTPDQVVRASLLTETSVEFWGGRREMEEFASQQIARLQAATTLQHVRVDPVRFDSPDGPYAETPVDGRPSFRGNYVGLYAWGGDSPGLHVGEAPAAGLVFNEDDLTAMGRAAFQSSEDSASYYWEAQGKAAGLMIGMEAQQMGQSPSSLPADTVGQGLAIAVQAEAPLVEIPASAGTQWVVQQGSALVAKSAVEASKAIPYVGPAITAWDTVSKIQGIPSPASVLADRLASAIGPHPEYRIEGRETLVRVATGSISDMASDVFNAIDPALGPATHERFLDNITQSFSNPNRYPVRPDLPLRPDRRSEVEHPDGRSVYRVVP
ncbi:MAG: hypothetical protein KDB86_12065 [Actinobacteria bacterium]|nr:hypothetical protein [Actinomycetota bacterium]MCB9389575.1 hypothetical protein [Acidimicrobiia bacterium]